MNNITTEEIKIINEDEAVFLNRLLILKEKLNDDEIQIDENLIPLIIEKKPLKKETALQYIYEKFFNSKNKDLINALYLLLFKDFRTQLSNINSIESITNLIIEFIQRNNLSDKSSYFEEENILTKSKDELIKIAENIITLKEKLNNNCSEEKILNLFFDNSDFSLLNKYPTKYSLTYIYTKQIITDFLITNNFTNLLKQDNKLNLLIQLDRHIKTSKINSPLMNCKINNLLLKYLCYSEIFIKKIKEFFNNDEDDDFKDIMQINGFSSDTINNITSYLKDAITSYKINNEIKEYFNNDYEDIIKTLNNINVYLLETDNQTFKSTLIQQLTDILLKI